MNYEDIKSIIALLRPAQKESGRIYISDYISSLRDKEGLTMEEFGNKYGLSRAAVSRYELGLHDDPTRLIARKFCQTFNIDPEDFITHFFFRKEKILKERKREPDWYAGYWKHIEDFSCVVETIRIGGQQHPMFRE